MDETVKTEKSGWRRCGATTKGATTTKTRLLRCRRRGFENNDAEVTHGLLGKDEKKESDEEQGERSEQLSGDQDAATSPHGGRARDHPLVREEDQRRLQSARGLENPTSCVSQDVRCQIGERSTRIPCNWFAECTFQVVYTSVLVHEEKERIEWSNLHVGAERRVTL